MSEFYRMAFSAHDPLTHERLAPLPHPLEAALGLPWLDTPTATLTYPVQGAHSSLIGRPIRQGLCVKAEVAFSTDYRPRWREVPGGYFALVKRETDMADQQRVVKCELVNFVAYQLTGAALRHNPAAKYNADGNRQFLSATPGAIMRTFVQEIQARGEMRGVEIDFTATRDSAGKPWASVITLAVEEGRTDALTVLRSLADKNQCDWYVEGRTLRMFNVDGAVRDLSETVRLVQGVDVSDAPQTESIEELVQEVVVLGDGMTEVVTDPTLPAPYGKRSVSVEMGTVSDKGTARTLGEADLKKLGQVEESLTRELLFDRSRKLPMVHYRPGDWVTGPGPDGAMERLRAAQITLQLGAQGADVSGHVVLGTRSLDALLRMNRRVVGISGTGKGDGGGGVRPHPGPDRRVPAKVEGLTVSSNHYTTAEGRPRAIMTAAWAPVEVDVNAVALDVDRYEVQVAEIPTTGAPAFWTDHPATKRTETTKDDVRTGTTWQWRVRAVTPTGVRGAWSDAVEVVAAKDTTPPPRPAAPGVSSEMTVVRVDHSLLAASGGGQPADFSHLEVGYTLSEAAPTTPTTIHPVTMTTGAPVVTIPGLPLDSSVWVQVRAYDTSGNVSDWSAPASATVTPVVSRDLIRKIIDDPSLLGDDVVAAEHIAALAILADHISANAVNAGHIKAGSVEAQHLEAVLALVTRLIAGDSQGVAAEMDPTGLTIYDVSPDGDRYVLSSFGSGSGDVLAIRDATGEIVAAITAEGAVSGSTVESAGDMMVMGQPLVGRLLDHTAGSGVLDQLAWGVVAYYQSGYTYGESPRWSEKTGFSILEFTTQPGRTYRATIDVRIGSTTGGAFLSLRMNTAPQGTTPADPHPGDEQWGERATISGLTPTTGSYATVSMNRLLFTGATGAPERVKLLVVAEPSATASQPDVSVLTWSMTVEDIGPRIDGAGRRVVIDSDTAIDNSDGSKSGRFTTKWTATAGASYKGDGTRYSTSGDLVHGRTPHWTAGGRQRAFIAFAGPATGGDEKGRTMAAALSGATIRNVRVRLRSRHSHYAAGTAVIRPGGHSSPPTTLGTHPTSTTSGGWARGQTRWVKLQPDYVSASETGIALCASTDHAQQYMRFWGPGSGSPPQIEVTYDR